MELLIVTGMSGAGKSQAANILEDIGFYCVDNVPPAMIPAFADLAKSGNLPLQKLALVTDARGGDMFNGINEVLADFKTRGTEYKVLFLDTADEELVRRYKENRREHPLSRGTGLNISSAIKRERETLEKIRIKSDYIIDTTHIPVALLRQKLSNIFCGGVGQTLNIQCESFGFKYGPDNEADLVFDVRCLPNPFYDEKLKEKTGLDLEVKNYVLDHPESQEFLTRLTDFITFAVPLYAKEGKSRLTIAFGCTGGKHRSVTFAEEVGNRLKAKDYNCSIVHRDIMKR